MSTDINTPAAAPLSRGNDVMVVEDDPRVRKMLTSALKEMGFAATFCATAEAAARMLANQSFDTLILDLNLPGLGGIEFLEYLRRQGCNVPAIIMTGFGDLEAAKKAIHLDVVDFLTKPCTLGNLEVALARAKSRRKGQIIDRASASTQPELQLEELPRSPRTFAPTVAAELTTGEAAGSSVDGSMGETERRHILAVLQKHNGNRSTTAAELGISVRKLYYRLGEYQRKGITS